MNDSREDRMHVTVVPHESSRLDFQAWEARVLSRPGGTREVFRLLVKEMKAELIRLEGIPDIAVLLKGEAEPTYLWRYASDNYVRFQVEERQGFPFAGITRRVLIQRLTPHPPE